MPPRARRCWPPAGRRGTCGESPARPPGTCRTRGGAGQEGTGTPRGIEPGVRRPRPGWSTLVGPGREQRRQCRPRLPPPFVVHPRRSWQPSRGRERGQCPSVARARTRPAVPPFEGRGRGGKSGLGPGARPGRQAWDSSLKKHGESAAPGEEASPHRGVAALHNRRPTPGQPERGRPPRVRRGESPRGASGRAEFRRPRARIPLLGVSRGPRRAPPGTGGPPNPLGRAHPRVGRRQYHTPGARVSRQRGRWRGRSASERRRRAQRG
mmetsp:Transcript_7803/g.22155  ORF Transcript_7803/g.22155 Transcript_7803/m.22155 type:complete len:266 (-) Transcript_7803:1059-1856(-)